MKTIFDIFRAVMYSFLFVVITLTREEILTFRWVGLFIIISVILYVMMTLNDKIEELEKEIHKKC